MTIKTKMILNKLELSLLIGCNQAEQFKKQTVTIDIDIHFANPPNGCLTDNLTDTYCYDALIKEVKKNTEGRQFRLIEHLGQEIYRIIKELLSPENLIMICVTKKPSITSLTGGASFYYGDEKK